MLHKRVDGPKISGVQSYRLADVEFFLSKGFCRTRRGSFAFLWKYYQYLKVQVDGLSLKLTRCHIHPCHCRIYMLEGM